MPDSRNILPLSRRGFVMTALMSGFTLAAARGEGQEIKTDLQNIQAGEIKIPVSDGGMPAYYARPQGDGPFPIVLVVEEIFGVHEYIKDICRRFAKLGYLAVAPELFARQGDVSAMTDVQQIIRDVVSKTPDSQVLSDLDAAMAWAISTGKGDGSKLGITGFCRGGRAVWLYGAHQPALKAGVAWYGHFDGERTAIQPKTASDVVGDLKAPVLGLYGGADTGIPVSAVEAQKQKATAAGKTVEMIVFPDAPHGFHADYRPSYRKQAADDAWRHMLDWFKRYGVA